jgi:hypothetical protein
MEKWRVPPEKRPITKDEDDDEDDQLRQGAKQVWGHYTIILCYSPRSI